MAQKVMVLLRQSWGGWSNIVTFMNGIECTDKNGNTSSEVLHTSKYITFSGHEQAGDRNYYLAQV